MTGEMTPVTFCHCSKCRKWHGHVGAYAAVDRPDFRYVEQRAVKWFQATDTIRRGFCGECGSSLFWDEEGEAKLSICAGSFDGASGLRPKAHIFLGSKGDYYDVPDDGLIRRNEFTS